MKRGILLSVALTISGLISLFMLWVQIALSLKIFVIHNVAHWADISGWFGVFATVIIVLSSISNKPINPKHQKAIQALGITLVCLTIIQFLFNHIYVSIETHHFL